MYEIVTIAVPTTNRTVSPERYHDEFVSRFGHVTVQLCQASCHSILCVRELFFGYWCQTGWRLRRDGGVESVLLSQ